MKVINITFSLYFHVCFHELLKEKSVFFKYVIHNPQIKKNSGKSLNKKVLKF